MRGGDGAAAVGVPVALVAEKEVVGGAAEGDGLGGAVVADLRAHVLPGEQVGAVHVLVAEQAELGGVRLAVEHRQLLTAEIAGNSLSGSRFRTHHPQIPTHYPKFDSKPSISGRDGEMTN